MRVPRAERWTFAFALAESPRSDIDALVETLAVGEALALVEMTSEVQRMPKWFKGNERLADAGAGRRQCPGLLGNQPTMLMAAAYWRDEVRYGRGAGAFLGFALGKRAQVIEAFGAVLAAPEALAAVERAVKRHPKNSEFIWLHRQIIKARERESGAFPAGLAIRIADPAPSAGQEVSAHLLIDGVPLVPRAFDLGFPHNPETLLHRAGGLQATAEPREVELAEASCAEGCCGALMAEIRRDEAGGRVEWEIWRTRNAHENRERFSFDAEAYDAEIARAAGDFTWEWPARACRQAAARAAECRAGAPVSLGLQSRLGEFVEPRAIHAQAVVHVSGAPDVHVGAAVAPVRVQGRDS